MTTALRRQLHDALATLAMSWSGQLDRARALKVGIDEVALEFDDVAPARSKLVADGELSQEQTIAIGRVEAQLREITAAGGRRWTEDALRTGEDWAELRRLAQAALDSMR